VIRPSRDFGRFVHPRRDDPLAPPPRVDAAHELGVARTHWAKVRSYWVRGWSHRKDAFVALEQTVDELLRGSTLPATFDLETLAAAERMLNGPVSVVGFVAARFGAVAALRTKARALSWNVGNGRAGNNTYWKLVDGKPPYYGVDSGWHALRRATCAAPAEAYAEAREIARGLREAEAQHTARTRIDFAFPSEAAWADEDMRAVLGTPTFSRTINLLVPLLACLASEDTIVRFLRECTAAWAGLAMQYACDVVLALPPDGATRVLAELAKKSVGVQRDPAQLRKLACAMTALRTEAMARELATWLRHPRFGRHVAPFFEEEPELARTALAEIARGKNVAADDARALLAANDRRAEPDQGSMDDAPPILRDPPWERAARASLALERLVWPESVAWEAGERERLAATPPVLSPAATIRPITAEELVAFDALPEQQKYVDVWPRWDQKKWSVLELPDDRVLALWDAGTAHVYHRPVLWMLARFGERALDGLYARDPFASYDERLLHACLRVDSPRSAMVVARLLARRRSFRKRARAWLLEHPEAAVVGLVPPALGREGRSRRIACDALRFVAARRPEVVDAVAARYGADAHAAIAALVFADPLARIDVRGKPPRWLAIESLPPLRTREGRVLPREAAARVVDVLRAHVLDVPYAGVAVLRDALDPASLERFAWAVFASWLRHGRPRTHAWAAHALAAFATGDTAMRLRPYARELAHTHPRAFGDVVDALVEIGDDASRLVLAELDTTLRAPSAREALAEALASHSDEPVDLGLDGRGEATLDLGGRTVRVVLGESLEPMVVLPDGRRVAQVPRASKTDDPERVAAATARFKRIRRAAHAVAKTEVARLERAMLASRRFRAAELAARSAKNALVAQAAKRVVWGVFEAGALVATFRVTEDGAFADDHDLPTTLDDDALVGVVHPLDLDADALARWGTIFGDYEIVQPFEQIGRITFAGTPAEAAEILKSTKDRMVPARSLLRTLETHGWTRATGRRVSSGWREVRTSKSTMRFVVAFQPGIDLEKMRDAPPQKLGPINVGNGPGFDEIGRVDRSELVRTALTLRG